MGDNNENNNFDSQFLEPNYLQSLLRPSSNQTMPGAQIPPATRNISQMFGSPIASIDEVQQPRLLTTLPEVRTPQNVDSDNSNSGYLRRSPRMILQISANDPCPAVPTCLYQYNGLKCPSPATFNWEDQLPVKGATYCVGHKLEGMVTQEMLHSRTTSNSIGSESLLSSAAINRQILSMLHCATRDRVKNLATHFKLSINTKSESKVAIIDALVKMLQPQSLHDYLLEKGFGLKDEAGTPRKMAHCTFRLLNVLFSEKLYRDFQNSERQCSRQELDARSTRANSPFWARVATEYTNLHTDTYNFFVVDDARFNEIRPQVVQMHSGPKLYEIWTDVRKRFMVAFRNSKRSGHHNPQFWDYCGGKIDVLYLHYWLQNRPGLFEFVCTNIPDEAQGETMPPISVQNTDNSSAPSLTPPTPLQKGKRSLEAMMQNSTSEKLIPIIKSRATMANLSDVLQRQSQLMNDLRQEPDPVLQDMIRSDLRFLIQQKEKLMKEVNDQQCT